MAAPKSSLAHFTEATVELIRSVGWFGIAIALSFLFMLRVSLAKDQRRALRAPTALLIAHVVLRIGLAFLPESSPAHSPVYFFSLFTLLLSIGRSVFLLAFDILLGRRLARPLPAIIRDILQGLVYAGVALVTLRAVGVEAASLLTTSALLTAVVGLSLQDTLGNVFAGLAIQAQRPFEVDDWIELEEGGKIVGRVVEINWRATRVLTRDEVEVVVPNSALAKAPIRNYSKPTTLIRRNLYVQAAYEAPPATVQAAIDGALAELAHVEDQPSPSTVVKSFDDSGITYWVRYYTRNFQRSETTDAEVRARIWYALKRANINIPFPIRTLHMVQTDAAAEQAATRRRRAEALGEVPIFETLPAEALELLTASSVERLYAPGETIIRQGDAGDELFVIDRGEVSVIVQAAPDSVPSVVAELGPGDFFGEMSLMTGEERTATVRAEGQCTVVVVDKLALAPILDRYPGLVEDISHLLARRQAGLAHHLGSVPPERRARVEDQSHQLLGRIRSFFSL
ncbi:MAG: mechanosensitive ion channel family protein [Myxococcales bacterium]|nr:mechanosensitive ion channel family protein [Myxococcales bacterium]